MNYLHQILAAAAPKRQKTNNTYECQQEDYQ